MHAILPGASGNIGKGLGGVFTRRYGLKRLVWCEYHDTIMGAIQREKTLKHWPRAWKVRLIHAENPDWDDLYETMNQWVVGVGEVKNRGWPGQARP